MGGYMGIRIQSLVVAFLLGCGLLAHVAPTPAAVIDLLRVNFNNVDVGPTDGQVDIGVAAPFLPSVFDWDGTVNVRGEDNNINTLGGNNGFDGHFTSNFLVLGDAAGQIGGDPNEGMSRVRLSFVIPVNTIAIAVSFRSFFNGTDTAVNRMDEFIVRVNDPGPEQNHLVRFQESPDDFCGCSGLQALFPVFNDADPSTISPGDYLLVFRLNEDGAGTNTAAGVDRIRVRAFVVPEPGTWALLASGLILLALRARRPVLQRARR
jgi:hypothetical protein